MLCAASRVDGCVLSDFCDGAAVIADSADSACCLSLRGASRGMRPSDGSSSGEMVAEEVSSEWMDPIALVERNHEQVGEEKQLPANDAFSFVSSCVLSAFTQADCQFLLATSDPWCGSNAVVTSRPRSFNI